MSEMIAMIFLCVLYSWLAWNVGLEEGRIQVASGEYVCQLIEQPDKTSEWECEE